MKPVVIDLCCGLGGWSAGFLAEGWDAIGFDIEKHEYWGKRYPGELILKSILEINGYDLRAVNPALVVASPPCQNYSYMAMPWTRAKEMAARIRQSSDEIGQLNALYNACFRIARQIGCPIILENVKGAQPWVGRAKAHFGSYYLWGDVADVGGRVVRADAPTFGSFTRAHKTRGVKCPGNDTFKVDGTPVGKMTDLRYKKTSDGVKIGGDWFASGTDCSLQRRASSKSTSRKAASALIAEIPFELASYIARAFKPAVIHCG